MPKFVTMKSDALSKLIGAIGKRKVALDKAVQDAAVQCVAQSIEHRNATPGMQLFDALGTSSRRDALVSYLEAFGNFAWNKVEKKLAFADNARELSDEHMEKATVTLWFTMKKEPVIVSTFDADEAFDKLIDRVRKMSKRGVTIINGEVLAVMEKAYAQFKAAQLQAETTPELKDALEARATGTASPAQLAKLTEHFSRQVTQVAKAA